MSAYLGICGDSYVRYGLPGQEHPQRLSART